MGGGQKLSKIKTSNKTIWESTSKTLIFSDTGVTGTANTNYNTINNALHTVGATGTKINSNTSIDGYYRANQLITGDFEVTFTFVEGGNVYYPDVAFLDGSNNRLFGCAHNTSTPDYYFYDTIAKASCTGAISNNEVWKIIRIGNKISFYVNNVLKYEYTGVSTNDCYLGWKTHSNRSRWFRFKDLKIFKVD